MFMEQKTSNSLSYNGFGKHSTLFRPSKLLIFYNQPFCELVYPTDNLEEMLRAMKSDFLKPWSNITKCKKWATPINTLPSCSHRKQQKKDKISLYKLLLYILILIFDMLSLILVYSGPYRNTNYFSEIICTFFF